jgi:hypothetical protein
MTRYDVKERERIKAILKFLIGAIAQRANNLEDQSTEDKEIVINEVFNFLVNTLHPQIADLLLQELIEATTKNKEILEKVKKIEVMEIMEEITSKMRNSINE